MKGVNHFSFYFCFILLLHSSFVTVSSWSVFSGATSGSGTASGEPIVAESVCTCSATGSATEGLAGSGQLAAMRCCVCYVMKAPIRSDSSATKIKWTKE